MDFTILRVHCNLFFRMFPQRWHDTRDTATSLTSYDPVGKHIPPVLLLSLLFAVTDSSFRLLLGNVELVCLRIGPGTLLLEEDEDEVAEDFPLPLTFSKFVLVKIKK